MPQFRAPKPMELMRCGEVLQVIPHTEKVRKRMRLEISGILPAVITPLTDTEEFAPDVMERLLERLYAAGSSGVYVCGETGEGLLLPIETRERIAEVAVRCSPADKIVIIHVGAACPADAVRLAQHAARVHAHAISSLPPPGSYSFSELKRYYTRLAAASDLPVLAYYCPGVNSTVWTAEQILEICSLPNVIGLKFSDFDLFKLSQIKAAGPIVLNGMDEVLVAGLLMGADGGIGTFYNIIPELFVQVYENSQRREWVEARRAQRRINELLAIALRFPVIPAVKAMLTWSGIDCGPCLVPRRGLTIAEQSELRRLLGDSNFAGFRDRQIG